MSFCPFPVPEEERVRPEGGIDCTAFRKQYRDNKDELRKSMYKWKKGFETLNILELSSTVGLPKRVYEAALGYPPSQRELEVARLVTPPPTKKTKRNRSTR